METEKNISRRTFLAASGLGAAVSVMPTLVLAKAADKSFQLRAEPVGRKLVPGVAASSDLWLYNGETPGPEIRVKQGETIRVKFTNNLPEPTSIHWHGIRIDNAMDGVAGLTQDAVPPGGTFNYEFTVPDAGTFWYHAHNKSWEQVARGLYGPLIVEETEPVFDSEHDITLVIDDWQLNKDGSFNVAGLGSFGEWSHGGRFGNWVTVNGLPARQTIPVKAGEAYRIRLVNAANARVFGLDPTALGAKVIAYDGQALPEAVTLPYEPLLLAPAQRVDLLITPKAGDRLKLSAKGDLAMVAASGEQEMYFAEFVAEGEGDVVSVSLPKPNELPEPDLLSAKKVPILMEGGAMGQIGKIIYNGKEIKGQEIYESKQVWTFNSIANLSKKPLFQAKRGETVEISFDNKTGWLHAMHVHGHHFRVLERSGSNIDEGQPWRDTFAIGPDQTTQIAFVADNPGKWLLHCHMLEHAVAGMRTWFEVV
ncbi:MAG: multicopper oxidase family protein [Ahrensia sp.]|nr:multicopper oxidase family protein [Ahrensia sp.]